MAIDRAKLKNVLTVYKEHLLKSVKPEGIWWENEKSKWQAVNTFKRNWDLSKDDLGQMLADSMPGPQNSLKLDVQAHEQPLRAFWVLIDKGYSDEIRQLFTNLYDESKDIYTRVDTFKTEANKLIRTLNPEHPKKISGYRQTLKSTSTYLFLKYPEKYYIYKYTELHEMIKFLGDGYVLKGKGDSRDLQAVMPFWEELQGLLAQDAELVQKMKELIEKENLAEGADTYYTDPKLHTLVQDIYFFYGKHVDLFEKQDLPKRYWWINTNPAIWSFESIDPGQSKEFTLLTEKGRPRQIADHFNEVQPEDKVIGYETSPTLEITALCSIEKASDGNVIVVRKDENADHEVSYKMLKKDSKLSNMEFLKRPIITLGALTKEEYDHIVDMVKNGPKDTYTKKDFLNDVFMTEKELDDTLASLKYKKNIILQGPPGVGKTYMAEKLAYLIMGKMAEDHVKTIQFHQSYSYENFVEGYKPSNDGKDGFHLSDGIFKKLCKEASDAPEEKFFLIIDEINRGNLSKIFGELLMSIENGYRGEAVVHLAYSDEEFTVPENLYIIGCMNTADRSLAIIDYALRRRFAFIPLEPKLDDAVKWVRNHWGEGKDVTPVTELIEAVKKLNTKITDDSSLGEGFCIGHSYFMRDGKGEGPDERDLTPAEIANQIVKFDLEPLLKEYWFDEKDKVKAETDSLKAAIEKKTENTSTEAAQPVQAAQVSTETTGAQQ